MCQVFLLVSEVVHWGAIPQHLVFGPVALQQGKTVVGIKLDTTSLTSPGGPWFHLVKHSLMFNLIPNEFSDKNGPWSLDG